MTPAALVAVTLYLASALSLVLGAMMALSAAAPLKRVLGLAVALVGAGLMAAALGAAPLALAAATAAVSIVLLGGAIVARLHEAFSGADWDELARAAEEDAAR